MLSIRYCCHIAPDPHQEFVNRYSRSPDIFYKRFCEYAIFTISICRHTPGSRGKGDEGACGRIHTGKATATAPETAGKGVVPAGVEENEIKLVGSSLHSTENLASIKAFEFHILFNGYLRIDWDQVVSALDLESVTCIIEQSNATAF